MSRLPPVRQARIGVIIALLAFFAGTVFLTFGIDGYRDDRRFSAEGHQAVATVDAKRSQDFRKIGRVYFLDYHYTVEKKTYRSVQQKIGRSLWINLPDGGSFPSNISPASRSRTEPIFRVSAKLEPSPTGWP